MPVLPMPFSPASGAMTNAPLAMAALSTAPPVNRFAIKFFVAACFGLAARSAGGMYVLVCWIVTGFPLYAAQILKTPRLVDQLERTLAKAEKQDQQICILFRTRQIFLRFS